MDRIKIKSNRFTLSRIRDGAGDYGPMLDAIDETNGKQVGECGEIIVGKRVMCGVYYPRTYGQDYWMTTNVLKIYEYDEKKKTVKFTTKNSDYVVTWE